jgi:hypothetical protein
LPASADPTCPRPMKPILATVKRGTPFRNLRES